MKMIKAVNRVWLRSDRVDRVYVHTNRAENSPHYNQHKVMVKLTTGTHINPISGARSPGERFSITDWIVSESTAIFLAEKLAMEVSDAESGE